MFDEQMKLHPDDRALGLSETLRICEEEGYLVDYLKEHRVKVEKIMLAMYEPGNVKKSTERSMRIYGAISAYKRMGASDEKIAKEISDEYEISPTYASNYIKAYEEELKEETVPYEA